MGRGDLELKNKEASASEEGDNNQKKNEAMFNLASWLAAKATVEPPQPTGAGEKKLPTGAGAGAGEKKKLVRLTQELIDQILRMPFPPTLTIPEERLAMHSEQFRANYAEKRAINAKIIPFEEDVISQYRTKGYAEVEVEN